MCSGDWYRPGKVYLNRDGSPTTTCDNVSPGFCRYTLLGLLLFAVPSPNGYVTALNCPICGCTPGENDAITMTELEAGARSADINIQEILSELTNQFEASPKN